MLTLPAEPRPALTPPTEAQRADMRAGVERMVTKVVNGSKVRPADREDAGPAGRRKRWELSGKFDPAGPAKWSTFAMPVAGQVCRQFVCQSMDAVGDTDDVPVDERPGGVVDPRTERRAGDDRDAVRPEDADLVRDLDARFRREQRAGVLGALTDTQRRFVGYMAFDGLTAGQAGDMLGWPRKVVLVNVRAAVLRPWRAGKVPPAMARGCGIDPAALAFKADKAAQDAHRAARRERARDALALGWTVKQVAAELGEGLSLVAKDAPLVRSGGPVRRSESVRAVPAARRRGQVRELLDRGYDPQRISAALGVPVSTIGKDVRQIRAAATAGDSSVTAALAS